MTHRPFAAIFGSWAVVALVGTLGLHGCTASVARDPAAVARCDAEAAARLVGKTKPSDAEAMRLTTSTMVRQIGPDQTVTQDFRDDRVTIVADPASGRVVTARCG